MLSTHGKLIDALDRVEDFLQKNGDLMSGVISSAAHQKFSASRARMLDHMKTQDAETRGSRSTVVKKRALRARLLRKHMRPISVIAKAELPDSGELTALTVPPRNKQFASLVAAGYGMATKAREHEAAFLAAGLEPGFIDRLLAATEALKESITAKGETTALRVHATAGLRKEARVARGNLRILDTLARAAIEDNDALLDRWESLSRVAAVATSSTAEDSSSGANTPPAEVPAAA